VLAPYWSEQMSKEGEAPPTNWINCRQCSKRGGELLARVDEDQRKVSIIGGAIIVLSGTLYY